MTRPDSNPKGLSTGRSQTFRSQGGFTIMEFVIASFIVLLVVGTFAVFMQATGVSMFNLSTQSTFNQQAGNAAEFIINRLRIANTAITDPAGDILTLTFDDNPEVDSNGDATAWNDIDHREQFIFQPTDGNSATINDNRILYTPLLGSTAARPLVSSGVRKLPNLQVFSVTNTATVVVNFGLLFTNQTVHSQAIEIRTMARLRNKIE